MHDYPLSLVHVYSFKGESINKYQAPDEMKPVITLFLALRTTLIALNKLAFTEYGLYERSYCTKPLNPSYHNILY